MIFYLHGHLYTSLLSNAGLFLFLFIDVYILEFFISTVLICYYVQCLVLLYAAATKPNSQTGINKVHFSLFYLY